MAGSYGHIVNNRGKFRGEAMLLDDMGDAYEAIEQCYWMIQWLSGGDKKRIKEAVKQAYRLEREARDAE